MTAVPPLRHDLDDLHAHLTAVHHLLHQLTRETRPRHPAAARQLAAARTRLFQAAAHTHDAYHQLPLPPGQSGPAYRSICRRHLHATHLARRTTTPTQLTGPPHGHTLNSPAQEAASRR